VHDNYLNSSGAAVEDDSPSGFCPKSKITSKSCIFVLLKKKRDKEKKKKNKNKRQGLP
jgi:hypothetical protein